MVARGFVTVLYKLDILEPKHSAISAYTDPSKLEALGQRWADAGPAS